MTNGATVHLYNNTPVAVTFGLCNAVHSYSKCETVAAGGNATVEIDFPDARVVAVWQANDPLTLYPSNQQPLTTGGLLEAGKTYRVVLDTGGITFGMQ